MPQGEGDAVELFVEEQPTVEPRVQAARQRTLGRDGNDRLQQEQRTEGHRHADPQRRCRGSRVRPHPPREHRVQGEVGQGDT